MPAVTDRLRRAPSTAMSGSRDVGRANARAVVDSLRGAGTG